MDKFGEAIPLSMGARPCVQSELPGVAAEVERLAAQISIPEPSVWILDCDTPNAFASGFTRYDSAITITTGVLEYLDHHEIKAVLAHEVGHIVAGDVQVGTALAYKAAVGVGVSFGVTVAASMLSLLTPGLLDDYLSVGVGSLVTNVVAKRAHLRLMRLQREREFAADAFSVSLGNGPWLASGLSKLELAPVVPEGSLPRWSRVLWVTDNQADSTHPPTPDRIRQMGVFSDIDLARDFCVKCYAAMNPTESFCRGCGFAAQRSNSECVCGTMMSSTDRFCFQCGVINLRAACQSCGLVAENAPPFCPQCRSPLP